MIDKIINYIEYLYDTHNFSISIHFSQKYMPLICQNNNLLKYNFHKNPYCFYIKKDKSMHRKCILCQYAVIRKCKTYESFIGICHANVMEYIERIVVKDEVAGFVSVSGYKNKKAIAENKYYDNLSDEEIPVELLEKVIPPLCVMLSEYIGKLVLKNDCDDIYLSLLSYLEEHHTDVNLDILCKKFAYSRSYISHMFKKRSGCTICHYCNMLKIRDAKLLLEQTDLSITNISYAVGFNDFSYFINTFRKLTGETPLVWRKLNKK